MSSVSRPAVPPNPYAPKVARLSGALGNKHWRTADLYTPDGVLKELVLLAIDRFDKSRRFVELAKGQAALASSLTADAWEAVISRTRSDATEQESALAFLIDATYNLLAPPRLRITEKEEAYRDRTTPQANRFIRRGFEAGGHAYILMDDVGNMRAGIIARVSAARAASL